LFFLIYDLLLLPISQHRGLPIISLITHPAKRDVNSVENDRLITLIRR